MKNFFMGVLCTLIVGLIGAAGIALTGSYDVAASDPHWPTTRWLLNTALYNAVKTRGSESPAPPDDFGSTAMVRAGFQRYDDTCVHCHGSAVAEPDAWAAGMRPQPPDLAQIAESYSDRELFWVVDHGIKMTGMPSFGTAYDDAALWELVAFVAELPNLDEQDYDRLLRESTASSAVN